MFTTIALLISIGGWGSCSRSSSRRGVLDDTLVIVTADHGEHLGDHLLFFHGCSLYRQLVQVPLVIVDPKGVPADRVVAEPVSLRDVPATVVDLLGLGRDAPFPGRSLARFWVGPDRRSFPRPSRCSWRPGKPLLLANQGREPAAKGPMKSLVAGGMHYIRYGRRARGAVRPQVRPGGAAQHGRFPNGPWDPPRVPGSPGGDAHEAVGTEDGDVGLETATRVVAGETGTYGGNGDARLFARAQTPGIASTTQQLRSGRAVTAKKCVSAILCVCALRKAGVSDPRGRKVRRFRPRARRLTARHRDRAFFLVELEPRLAGCSRFGNKV